MCTSRLLIPLSPSGAHPCLFIGVLLMVQGRVMSRDHLRWLGTEGRNGDFNSV